MPHLHQYTELYLHLQYSTIQYYPPFCREGTQWTERLANKPVHQRLSHLQTAHVYSELDFPCSFSCNQWQVSAAAYSFQCLAMFSVFGHVFIFFPLQITCYV